ncbi:DsbA family protein [Streptomyces collinus]|uniref:DsbA family protein n=1 Tax=Streptomyces collinus TaxID=42684 RepID=UPI00367D88E7
MQLVHAFDAYCGWSHGFSPTLREVVSRHPDLPVEVICGGLFTGSRRVPIREFGHVQDANAQIAELTGARFGEGYDRLIADGSFVMDSEAATYRKVAEDAGLDADAVVAAFESPEADDAAADDFRRCADLGVTGYPTLLAVDGGSVTALARGRATADEVDRRLAALS